MQMIVPILCGVLILVGFVALFMSRETWRAYQIVLVLFILIANVFFMYLAARTLHTHREWRNEVAKYEQAYAQQYDQNKLLTGELDGRGDVVVDREEKAQRDMRWSIDDWRNELDEAMYGRGRVIHTTGLPKVDPATGAIAAQAGEPVSLTASSQVQVFQTQQTQPPRERNLKYKGAEVTIATPPIVRYLGAYVVSAVNGREINLVPVYPEHRVEVNGPLGPLAIYEVMPLDTHEAFAQLNLDENTIKSLFPPIVPPEVVEQYLKDGKPADPKGPADERVWRRVRFTKEYAAKDDQAQPAPAAPPAAPPADAAAAPDAAAPDAGLEAPADAAAQGGVKSFQPGDEALLDPKSAQDLVDKLIAEYVESRPDEGVFSHVFVRPLHDYSAAFRNTRAELIATNLKTAELDRQIQAIQKSIKLAHDTQELRKQEAMRLAQDLQKFTFEADAMQKLHDAFVQSVKEATDRIAALKQSIASQAQELTRLQLRAAQSPSRRGAATASTR